MKTKLLLTTGLLYMTVMHAGEFDTVKITPDMSSVFVYHKSKAVKVYRIQDTSHKLTGEYAKTYRPGTFIQPIVLNNGAKTIGEVEVLKFMKENVNKKKGLIIDVRDKEAYAGESIPSAVNIPVKIIKNDSAIHKIFESLGMSKNSDGSWSEHNAMNLVIYCDGLWCKKSTEMINILIQRGYPAEKILYYRGGFQMWKILGFTTIKNK
jgi:rhodanese-related sulfurtransferase